MAGIIGNFINWASSGISKFFAGAADFLKKDVPKYMHGTGLNKQFYETIEKMSDEEIPNFVKQYSESAYKEVVRGSINGGTRLDAFKNMHSNYKAEVLREYGKAHKAEIDMKNAFNALDYGDAFKIRTQNQLDRVYGAINADGFETEYFKHQVRLAEHGKGMFADVFDFDFSNGGRNLNKEQMQALGKYFDEGGFSERLSRFTSDYLPEAAEDTSKLNYNLGMQKRYLRTKEGSRQLRLIQGKPGSKNGMRGSKRGESVIDTAIRKNASDADILNAHRDYLNKRLAGTPDIEGRWEAPDSFEKWATEQGIENSEIKRLSKELASGDPDHSGIGLWKFVKNHPRISTAMAVGGAWGISELAEDDSL